MGTTASRHYQETDMIRIISIVAMVLLTGCITTTPMVCVNGNITVSAPDNIKVDRATVGDIEATVKGGLLP